MPKIKDNVDVAAILREVSEEIDAALQAEATGLRKSAGEPENTPPFEETPGAPAPGAAEVSSPGDASATGPSPDVSASPEASPDDGSASPSPDDGSSPAPEDPAADQGMMDPAQLQVEYMKLPPELLKAHYMAAKAALFELMGAAQGASPSPDAGSMPPPGASPSPSPSPAPVPPAMKAEVPASIKDIPATAEMKPGEGGGKDAVPGDIKPLGKSEKDAKIEELEAQSADQAKQIELLAKAVELAMGTPVRKAITTVSAVPKGGTAPEKAEAPSKDAVRGQIRKAMSSGKLNKNEKDKIFSYTLGNTDFSEIAQILESATK